MEVKQPRVVRKAPFGERGNYYIGQYEHSMNKTPIVFVHGLHSHARKWFTRTNYYGKNDMYELAAHYGHPTAFVDLSTRKYGIWENGELLAKQLKEIYHRFGQKKLAIVAHSKGGVDAQIALSYGEAYPYVRSLITLGTPHYGSPLADLAFSQKAKPLAFMIGFLDKGTLQMQTGHMEKLRSVLDVKISKLSIPHFTIVGVDPAEQLGSILSMGGKYLKPYGENDGVVLAKDAILPYSKSIRGYWNHDNIRLGREMFPLLEELIDGDHSISRMPRYSKTREKIVQPCLLHGGYTSLPSKEIELHVPSQEREFWIQLLSSSKNMRIEVHSPDGKKEELEYKGFVTDVPFFPDTHLYYFQVPHPKQGKWKIQIHSLGRNAYFLVSSFSSLREEAIRIEKNDVCQGLTTLHFKLQVPDHWKRDRIALQVYTDHKRLGTKPILINELKKTSQREVLTELKFPKQQMIRNVHLEIIGESKWGAKVQRDYVTSLFL
ncbi:esterase/lipase family protein [Tepidibacillus sp. LV47]|uniref:esterase/lipase family protein n=1 Tax=Tepidibacillus sp. LV47 TaxID=3398228 RepID=UPI003AAE3D9D